MCEKKFKNIFYKRNILEKKKKIVEFQTFKKFMPGWLFCMNFVITDGTAKKHLRVKTRHRFTYHRFTIISPSLPLYVCLFIFCGRACHSIH